MEPASPSRGAVDPCLFSGRQQPCPCSRRKGSIAMGLTSIAVRRPLTVLMVFLMILVMGYKAYTLLEVERLPKTDLPIVSVRVQYPGASSEDVNTQIIKPLENAVAGI